MIKGILNIVPVLFYLLLESVFIAAIISTIWFFLFIDIRKLLGFDINFFQILAIVWSAKMILTNLFSISFNMIPINEENEV